MRERRRGVPVGESEWERGKHTPLKPYIRVVDVKQWNSFYAWLEKAMSNYYNKEFVEGNKKWKAQTRRMRHSTSTMVESVHTNSEHEHTIR